MQLNALKTRHKRGEGGEGDKEKDVFSGIYVRKARSKRYVFSCLLKISTLLAFLRLLGSVFQRFGA